MMKRLLTLAVLGVCVLGFTGIAPAADAPAPDAVNWAPAKKTRVAVIHLTQELKERPDSFSFSLADITGGDHKGPALSSLIVTLNKAAKDDSLGGVFLDMSSFSLTLNQAQELGELIKKVRDSGKQVAVYASDYDTATYVLASYATTVIMPENGSVLIPGVGLQMMFFKDALDKLHLQADFVQIGKFKGAEEPFVRSSASPEYKEQIQKLVDGMYSQLISIIAANRPNMNGETAVKTAVDEGWLSGKRAKEAGLVDQLMTRDRVDAWLNEWMKSGADLVEDYGRPKKKAVDMDSPFAIFSLLSDTGKPRSRQDGIAVIYAVGEIAEDFPGGEDSTEQVTPAAIRAAVDAALADSRVKAIVLRVDSPGGSASASDEIWEVLKQADKKKPVTVSMGRLAASGGYYISCAGRSIVADPATITGSIGVVAGKFVIKGLLDTVGINIETVSQGKHVDMLSMMAPFTDEERAFLKKSMEETYGVFSSRVMGARGAHIKDLEAVAQGRLFTGVQAKTAGLVDSVGTLSDAVAAAAKGAGIDKKDYQIIVLPETKSLADIIREGLSGEDMSLPAGLSAGIKFDGLDAMLQTLPAQLRGQVKSAMHMVNMLQHEGTLMALPGGITEIDGRR
jgi:protease-4